MGIEARVDHISSLAADSDRAFEAFLAAQGSDNEDGAHVDAVFAQCCYELACDTDPEAAERLRR